MKRMLCFTLFVGLLSGCGGDTNGVQDLPLEEDEKSVNFTTVTELTEDTEDAGPSVWEQSVPLTSPRWGLSSCSHDKQIYVFGGAEHETTVEMFDTETQTWEQKNSLPSERRYGLACAVIDNKIYIAGGYSLEFSDPDTWYMDALDVYDVTSGTWSSLSAMPVGRISHALVARGNKLYAIGGENRSATYVSQVDEYDPETDSWSSKASLPVGHRYVSSEVVDGLVYVFGGWNSAGPSTLSYVYDPELDTWSEIAFLPEARYSHSSTAVGGKIYLFGGGGNPTLSDVDVYDPVENAWTENTPMNQSRSSHASTAVSEVIYVIGGRESSAYASPLSDVSVYNPALDN